MARESPSEKRLYAASVVAKQEKEGDESKIGKKKASGKSKKLASKKKKKKEKKQEARERSKQKEKHMAEARKAQEHEVRKGEGARFLSVQGATLGSGSRLPGTASCFASVGVEIVLEA